MKILFLVIGGSLGTLLRYGVYTLTGPTYAHFPIKTFAINVVGCFLIGFFVQNFNSSTPYFSSEFKLLFITGFCGAFTTFSTFIFEANALADEQKLLQAFLYIALSILFGFVALYLGLASAKLLIAE